MGRLFFNVFLRVVIQNSYTVRTEVMHKFHKKLQERFSEIARTCQKLRRLDFLNETPHFLLL